MNVDPASGDDTHSILPPWWRADIGDQRQADTESGIAFIRLPRVDGKQPLAVLGSDSGSAVANAVGTTSPRGGVAHSTLSVIGDCAGEYLIALSSRFDDRQGDQIVIDVNRRRQIVGDRFFYHP